MIFNLDLNKQAQEVILCSKTKKLLHPSLLFNNIFLKNSVSKTSCADIRCKAEIRWAHKNITPKLVKL